MKVHKFINIDDANKCIFVNTRKNHREVNGEVVRYYEYKYPGGTSWFPMTDEETIDTTKATFKNEDGGWLTFRNIKYRDQTVEGKKFQCTVEKKWYFVQEGCDGYVLMKDKYRVMLDCDATDDDNQYRSDDYYIWKEVKNGK